MSNVFLIVAVTITANKKVCMCVRNNPKRDVITCDIWKPLFTLIDPHYRQHIYHPIRDGHMHRPKLVWFVACGIILENINLVPVRTDVFCIDFVTGTCTGRTKIVYLSSF
jgi:hypothetical protein